MFQKFVSFIPWILTASLTLWATPESELLESRLRPTVAKVIEKLKPWPAQNPFQGTATPTTINYLSLFPERIAALEKAFPNAIWLPVGRDSAVTGDALEAFYEALGEKNRVRPIYAGTNSIFSATNGGITGMIESLGYNPKTTLDPATPPFILLDSTSYQETSQSRKILRALYDQQANLGHSRKALVRKLNFINLWSIGGIPITADTDLEKFLNEQGGKAEIFGVPDTLFRVQMNLIQTRGTGRAFSYDLEWHDSFGDLHQQPDGRIHGSPGGLNHISTRHQILWQTYELINIARDPKFLKSVKAKAKELNSEFLTTSEREAKNKCTLPLARAGVLPPFP